jgi:hypothetical protein
MDEFAIKLTEFMESNNAAMSNLAVHLSALEEFLESHYPNFWDEFQPLLDAARKQQSRSSGAWNPPGDAQSH